MMINVPIFSFSGSKYDQDTAGEVTVSLNLYFGKPRGMSPRDSLDFEYQISRKI